MSIDVEIVDQCARGMLFPVSPWAHGTSSVRAMFVEERLWGLLHSPEGDEDWEKRIGYLQADLDDFVTGEPIRPKYLFLLSPSRDAIWEIRSVQEDPSIRVLGKFAKIDVYIATNFALRGELGGWESKEWREAKRFAGAVWRKIFPTYPSIVTTDVNDVVTGAINGRYFKNSR
jgi:hypothetical protein